METKKKKLPVGIEMFRDIREHDFYYIDKTGFIKELLESWTEVNLFTRPRRFGKSLNMDMLKAFFEIGTDKRLFDGLEISAEKQICEEYMGKFSVISVSLKDVEGNSFEEAKDMLETVISDEALRFQYLMDSPKALVQSAHCSGFSCAWETDCSGAGRGVGSRTSATRMVPVWSTAYTLQRPPTAICASGKRMPPSSVRSMR